MNSLNDFPSLTSCCFLNTSLESICTCRDTLDFFLKNNFHPEISLEGNFLWDVEPKQVEKVAQVLEQHGLACTLHAPFQDLAPGGFDKRITALTREKLHRAFSLLPLLQPKSIVCHLGYEPFRHTHKMEHWLSVSVTTWAPLLATAAENKIQVMFENTYEPDPTPHKLLFAALSGLNPGFCLDTGHVIAFSSTPWQLWVQELSPWLGQLHLHDNEGSADSHDPIGRGIFDFASMLKELSSHEKTVFCTLEQRSEAAISTSLQQLASMETTCFSTIQPNG